MGTAAQLLPGTPGSSVIIMQVFVVLSLAASAFGLPSAQYAGYGEIGFGPGIGHGLGPGIGHHKDPCEESTETIMVKECHLEPDKSCSSEEVVVGSKVVGHEDPVCEEVEGCVDPHQGYGKRAAQFGFGGHPGFGYHETPCVKHKVCKQGAPIEKDVTKEVETCAVTSKEVCEDVEKKVPKLTCKKHKPVEHY